VFFVYEEIVFLVYKSLQGEHAAAYNVDVANGDRRKRESNAFEGETLLYCMVFVTADFWAGL
jgi:hypothetical protein